MIYHSQLGHTLVHTKDGLCFVVKTPEFKKAIDQKIKILRGEIKTLEEFLYEAERYLNDSDSSYSEKEAEKKFKFHFPKHVIKQKEKQIEELERGLKSLAPPKEFKEGGYSGTILEAKQVPISDYIKFDGGGKANCPFHAGGMEKTASLKYYKASNRVHCFGGCSQGYDVIDVVQKLYGYTVPQAIKFIINK